MSHKDHPDQKPLPIVEVIEIFEHDPEVVRLLKIAICELREIRRELEPRKNIPAQYRITQENSMAILGIAPGATGTFAANPSGQPQPNLPLTVVPVWKSSDPLAVVTASADGLTSSVVVDPTATAGGSFNLSVANPDGSADNTVIVPYTASTNANVPTSFGISQTS